MGKSVNKNKKSSIFSKRNIAFAVVVLIIATPLVAYGINSLLYNLDKERFHRVKSDVEEIGSKLRSQAADWEWKTEESCVRAHLTFGDGDASCEIRVDSTFNVADDNKAQLISQSLDTVLADSTVFRIDRRSRLSDTFLGSSSPGYSGDSYRHEPTGMNCSTLKKIEQNGSIKEGYVSFSCRDYSRDTWFPRSDL